MEAVEQPVRARLREEAESGRKLDVPARRRTEVRARLQHALAALTLQVYYRFLPTYQAVEINKDVAAAADADVTIALQ